VGGFDGCSTWGAPELQHEMMALADMICKYISQSQHAAANVRALLITPLGPDRQAFFLAV
jgi:hypothetical protein